jgi:hypothetical protein
MQICGLEIEIFVSCMIMVIIMMDMFVMSCVPVYTMCMISVMPEDECTDYIDQESYYGDDQCHIIVDHQRRHESLYGKSSNKEPHNTQKYSTGIGSEYFYLPSTQCEPRILSMFTSKYICEE